MACRLYNTERCLQHQLFNRPNFGVHFSASPLTSFSEVQPTGPLLPLHNGTAFYGKFQTYYAI